MALYTLADLHLACAVDKPMDIFGGRWQDYMDKIQKRWTAVVSEQDTVVIGGDVSWGIDFKEAKADFAYLNRLPGHKIILKGNHDLWWNTMTKMNRFIAENGFQGIDFLHNNCYLYEDIGLCGTRGWFYEEDFKEQHDEKVFRRELMRLETSLESCGCGWRAGEILFPALSAALYEFPLRGDHRTDAALRRDPLYLRPSALVEPALGGRRDARGH